MLKAASDWIIQQVRTGDGTRAEYKTWSRNGRAGVEDSHLKRAQWRQSFLNLNHLLKIHHRYWTFPASESVATSSAGGRWRWSFWT